jgi:hypothetical protein
MCSGSIGVTDTFVLVSTFGAAGFAGAPDISYATNTPTKYTHDLAQRLK